MAPADLEYLEYEEEDTPQDDNDLFGSDPEEGSTSRAAALPIYNPARPIPHGQDARSRSEPQASTSRSAPGGGGVQSPGASRKGKEKAVEAVVGIQDVQERMNQLRIKKRGKGEVRRVKGVRSLRSASMAVIKANSSRIWDIGDMEYALIADFLNELPVDQLAEIESVSPAYQESADSKHIKKDTDWLWEYFILQEYPLFHERCNQRHGEARTSGWRRMYKKAKEDAEERKHLAADRLAQRYKQLEDEKSAKRIVFVDKITVPTRGKAARGRSGGMVVARTGKMPAPPPNAKIQGVFAKARQDAQRARIAITHASGKYTPPASSTASFPRHPQADLFKNPYLASPPPIPVNPKLRVDGPRLPAPRALRLPSSSQVVPPTKAPRSMVSPPSSPIPGSYPASEATRMRTALPAHLVPQASDSASDQAEAEAKRFKLEHKPKVFKAIQKPAVQNFEVPTGKQASPARGPMLDFFNPGKVAPPSSKPALGEKRKAADEVPPHLISQAVKASSIEKQVSHLPRVGVNPHSAFSSPEKAISADESARLSSVLFRKKARIRAKA